jgi:hypothetical protein
MPGVTEQAGGQRTQGGTDTDENAPGDRETDAGQQQSQESSDQETQQQSSQESSEQGNSEQGNADQPTQQHETQQRSQQSQQPSEQPSEQPTQRVEQPHGVDGHAPEGHRQRAPIDVGDLIWRIARILASAVRIVAYVLAVVLVAYIVLTLVGVNPQNGVARVIGGVADVAVLAFRDLFLIADPSFAVIVNYGLAAVFWLLVGEFGSRLIRYLGARLT